MQKLCFQVYVGVLTPAMLDYGMAVSSYRAQKLRAWTKIAVAVQGNEKLETRSVGVCMAALQCVELNCQCHSCAETCSKHVHVC